MCIKVCVCVCVSERMTIQSASKGKRTRTERRRPRECRNTGANETQKLPGWQNDHVQHTRVSLFSVYGYPQAHERRNQVLRSWIVPKAKRRTRKRKRDRRNGEGPEVYDVESCLRSLIESCLSVCMFVPRRWPMPSSPLLHWRHRQSILGGPGARDPAERRNRATKTEPTRRFCIFSRITWTSAGTSPRERSKSKVWDEIFSPKFIGHRVEFSTKRIQSPILLKMKERKTFTLHFLFISARRITVNFLIELAKFKYTKW